MNLIKYKDSEILIPLRRDNGIGSILRALCISKGIKISELVIDEDEISVPKREKPDETIVIKRHALKLKIIKDNGVKSIGPKK